MPVPEQIWLRDPPENPALPPRRLTPPKGHYATHTRGTGPKRIYLDVGGTAQHAAYPPRPVPGGIADLDVIMEHCDFSEKKVCPYY